MIEIARNSTGTVWRGKYIRKKKLRSVAFKKEDCKQTKYNKYLPVVRKYSNS
jgi:hypothetical protein